MSSPDDKAAAPPAVPAAPAGAQDLAARIRAKEAELAALRAQAPVPAGTVMLRLVQQPGGPDALIRGGYTITASPTPVPQHAVGMLLDAAADVGVTLEEA